MTVTIKSHQTPDSDRKIKKIKSVPKEDRGRTQGNCIDYVKMEESRLLLEGFA